MNPADTIVALASGRPVVGNARALVRISGRRTPALLGAGGLSSETVGRTPEDGPVIQRGELRLVSGSGDMLPLPCLVMVYPGDRSYTGEPAAELLVPGNPALVERVVGVLLAQEGVRLATPGEFSARAYLNGRLTLAQAEGVAATIAARTDGELAAAERLLNGETGEVFRAWRDESASLLALVAAGIDFTDQEDVVPIAPEQLAHRLAALAHVIAGHLGASHGAEHREGLATVALAGPPNAGKSTLFNALLGRRRAVVSDVAGTTRDVLAERLELPAAGSEGAAVMLLDLAGLDPSPGLAGADREAQARAAAALEQADIVVHCDQHGRFDAHLPGGAAQPVIRVRTKADLPTGGSGRADAMAICSLDGYNLPVLRRAIADALAARSGAAGDSPWLAPRHRRALTQTADSLRAALAHVQPHRHDPSLASPELTADALRSALDTIGELAGEVTPDDVIGRVFATFCVGK